MSWAKFYIEKLQAGLATAMTPSGNSMQPKIESGDLVHLVPVTEETDLSVGDIVLCKVSGRHYLHLVKAIDGNGRFQIGNNKGHINGWIGRNNIYGLVVSVQSNPHGG